MSFKYRFILAFVTLEAFFIILIVGMNFLTIEKNAKKHIQQEINTSKLLLTELVKAPMSVYDLATLDNIIENSKKIRDIKLIGILDKENRVISSSLGFNNLDFNIDDYDNIPQAEYTTKDGQKWILTYTDIINEDVRLGHIHLVFDITSQLKEIEENRSRTYLVIAIEILISTILAFFIGRRITDKLLKLSKVASNIGEDKKSDVPYVNTKDEIGILANAMNKMQDDIENRNDELKLFAKLFENTQEAIIITDKNKNIQSINSSFERITGYKKEEILSKKLDFLKSGRYDTEFYEQMWNSIIENGYWHGEVVDKRKDGSEFTAILNINAIKNEKDEITNFVGIWTDISLMKQKDKILQSQAKMATMGEMLSNIAHQWRQPLNAITTSTSSILVQKNLGILEDKDFDKTINNVIKYCNYLSQTIEDFRNFFKHDDKLVDFELYELINNDIVILETVLKNNHIELILDLEENIKITNYQNELIQALLNIVHNAKDALYDKPYDKYLFIRTYKKDNYAVIEVKDNGGGIKDVVIEKIFEPYFTTKHQSQGTGIGLYMTHTIITEHMKGKIYVENSSFKYKNTQYIGALFTIEIPLRIDK